MLSKTKNARTEALKRERVAAYAYSIEDFSEKSDAFKCVFSSAIVQQIVLDINRKTKRAYEVNLVGSSAKNAAHGKKTDADEVYAHIAILLHDGSEKSKNVHAIDFFHKSNMPFSSS